MKYFLHDTSAFQDEKITELFMAYGYEGLGLFYTILEKLAHQEKPVKTAVLKQQLSVGKKLERCWAFLEETGLISSNNGETFNDNLLKFSEKYQVSKEKTRERVARFRENQAVTKDVTRYDRVSNALKVKESKVNRTSNDVAPSPADLPALKARPERQAALANTDPDEEQHWSAGPLTKPGPFRVICERHPLGKGIAFEHYRLLALAAAEVKNISRTIAQWQSWIFKFLDHQKPVGGSLLTPAALATEAQTGARAPQSPDAIRFDLNPEATARRRREAEENRLHIMALNLERVRRNDELRGLTTTHISA